MHRLLAVYILVFALHALGQTESGFDPKQRIDRIRGLAKTNSAQAIPALTQSLKDRDRNVRVEAVKAIVKIDTEASLDPLIEAVHDKDSEVEIRATDGLVNFYLPGYVVKGGLTGFGTQDTTQALYVFAPRAIAADNDGNAAIGDIHALVQHTPGRQFGEATGAEMVEDGAPLIGWRVVGN